MEVSAVKTDNLMHAMDLIAEAKKQNADVVILPECFNSPYGTSEFIFWVLKILISTLIFFRAF
jgi:omega-amidase